MNYQEKIYIFLLFLAACIISASGLKCHVCSTGNATQQDCDKIPEGFTKYLIDCTAPHNETCRIQEQWVDFTMLNQTTDKRTIRQCASIPFDPDRPCYYRTGFGGRVNVCHCIGDGCNEASKTASTILLTIGLLLFIGLLS